MGLIGAGGGFVWTPGQGGAPVLLPESHAHRFTPVHSPETTRRVLGQARPHEGRFVAAALQEIARSAGESFDAVLKAYALAVELPEVLQKNDGTATGFLCESLGREMLQKLFPDCTIEHGVTLHGPDGKTAGELDAVMRDPNGMIVALAEVKLRPDALSKGRKKLRSLLEGIQNGSLTSYRLPDGSTYSLDEPGPYARDRFAQVTAEDCHGVTCSDGETDQTAFCVELSYQSICRIASILTHYAGMHTPPPAPELEAPLRRRAA